MPNHFVCSLLAYVLMTTAAPAARAEAPGAQASAARAAAPAEPISRATFIVTMDREYKKLDANNDGTVSRIELEASEQRKEAAEVAQRARKIFVKFDADKNAQLSLDEFIHAASGGPQQRSDIGPIMSRLDPNRDQKITLVEYRTITLTGFDRMDADKDGVVSVSEMRAGNLIK